MKRKSTGFTLIELVVVILILGILAGVGAPKLFSTSGLATENGLKQTLSIIRDGIELYSSKNAGAFPPCTAPGTDFQTAMAPYVRGKFPKAPVGSFQDSSIVPKTGTAALVADNTTAWMYNVTTGEFICNCTTVTPSGGGVTYDAL